MRKALTIAYNGTTVVTSFGTKEELLKEADTYMRNNDMHGWEDFSTVNCIKFMNRGTTITTVITIS